MFRAFGHCVSTFLHPFAPACAAFVTPDGSVWRTRSVRFVPPALPGFFATTGALCTVRSGSSCRYSRPLNAGPLARTGILPSRHRTFRPFHLQPPVAVPGTDLVFSPRLTAATALEVCRTHWAGFRSASFGLRHWLAGSPRQPAESSSSSYGLVIHLQLLPTSSHEDAVTYRYRVQVQL
jgi:hypothetical protein